MQPGRGCQEAPGAARLLPATGARRLAAEGAGEGSGPGARQHGTAAPSPGVGRKGGPRGDPAVGRRRAGRLRD